MGKSSRFKLEALAAMLGASTGTPVEIPKKGPTHPHSFLNKDEMAQVRRNRKKNKAARAARRINRKNT